jgi:hypothetical protein
MDISRISIGRNVPYEQLILGRLDTLRFKESLGEDYVFVHTRRGTH